MLVCFCRQSPAIVVIAVSASSPVTLTMIPGAVLDLGQQLRETLDRLQVRVRQASACQQILAKIIDLP